MKTTNYYFTKSYRMLALLLLLSCTLTSCMQKKNGMDEEGKGIKNPIPSENPVIFTAEAQPKVIWVSNLTKMYPENPKTDKTIIEEGRMVVENDWITITATHEEGLRIEVKENTTNMLRTYNLKMSGMPGEATLIITQNGKTN